MRIAVVGSRDFAALDEVAAFVRALSRRDMLVTGGARGVDKVAEEAAIERRIPRLIFEPECEEGEPGYVAALHARNDKIVRNAERFVIFWDAKSRGTKSMIEKATATGKPVNVRMARER